MHLHIFSFYPNYFLSCLRPGRYLWIILTSKHRVTENVSTQQNYVVCVFLWVVLFALLHVLFIFLPVCIEFMRVGVYFCLYIISNIYSVGIAVYFSMSLLLSKYFDSLSPCLYIRLITLFELRVYIKNLVHHRHYTSHIKTMFTFSFLGILAKKRWLNATRNGSLPDYT